MSTIFALLGVVALVVVFFAGSLLIGSLKEGDMAMSMKAGGIVAIAIAIVAIGMVTADRGPGAGNCYREWDGRANSFVCD